MDVRNKQRIALSAVFFQSGLCFSTWASRIPDIKQSFQLDDSALGALLLIKPIGSFVGLPLAGWFVDRYGSRLSVGIAITIYSISLSLIALSSTIPLLAASLLFFGVSGNLVNVSLNTQALTIQHNYGRVVMASFHGLWSLAGFCGALAGALAITLKADVLFHFTTVSVVIIVLLLVCYSSLNPISTATGAGRFVIKKPNRQLLHLGLIAFCGLMCEGCMFDWSGVYFKQVIQTEKGMVTAGFVAFMSTMTAGRFISDKFTNRFGTSVILQVSGVLIFVGLLVAVIFPYFITGLVGFLMVGAGTSSVIPLTYTEVGKTQKISHGMAIAMVATIGYFGFLLGPPLIGFIGETFNLRISFALVALAGITISILVASRSRTINTVQHID